MTPEQIREIRLPLKHWDAIVGHARRKLAGEYLPDEEAAPKAYGLVGGCRHGQVIEVTHVFPLSGNLRSDERYKASVDQLMDEVAVPSQTPFAARGWVAPPEEVRSAEQACDESGSMVFASYHMHRVPWDHDSRRDTCTELDARLGDGSGLWMLILSMVNPQRPLLRAFFEGRNDHEAPVHLGSAHE